VAAIFGIVNAILGPILHLVGLPLTILTLGLFALVVNAALLGIAAAFTSRLSIDGFWTAIAGALIISVVSALANRLMDPRRYRRTPH
jgi:putative membrane protein